MSNKKDPILDIIQKGEDKNIYEIQEEKQRKAIENKLEVKSKLWSYQYDEILTNFLLKNNINEDDSVLFIGIPELNNLDKINSLSNKTIFIDKNEFNINYFSNKYNLDAFYMNYPDEYSLQENLLDKIVFINSAENISDIDRLLFKIKPSLKSNGQIIMKIATSFKDLTEIDNKSTINNFTKDSLLELVEKTGYRVNYFTFIHNYTEQQLLLKLMKEETSKHINHIKEDTKKQEGFSNKLKGAFSGLISTNQFDIGVDSDIYNINDITIYNNFYKDLVSEEIKHLSKKPLNKGQELFIVFSKKET